MNRSSALLLVVCLFLVEPTGCYRTRYVNLPLTSQLPSPPVETQPEPTSGWRHFFIWGWTPAERVIDAAAECGGAEKVESIETRRRFVQGLIAAFAGYYINIYSPYNGKVICKGHIAR